MIDENLIKNILKRITRLEKAIFPYSSMKSQILKKKDFTGATGGIRFLISKGFLRTKRSLSDIRGELEKNNYHYSIQAAQSALNRLSKPGGLLVALKTGGKKVYVERK